MKIAGEKLTSCPNCLCGQLSPFFRLESVPVNSCILLPSKKQACDYPRGDINLGFCRECGFVSNTAFDSSLPEYSERYEETQGFSHTFNIFQKNMAEKLIQRYRLCGKQIIEIGCGKGEFLRLICKLGNNSGIGFDPAYIKARDNCAVDGKIDFIKDNYSEKYAYLSGDFFICKMTLEHIPDTFDFLLMVRHAMGDRSEIGAFFQVPDTSRILRDCSFEDIYYEHCSYFSPASLKHLFINCLFEIRNISKEYNSQYLLLESCPSKKKGTPDAADRKEIEALAGFVEIFEEKFHKRLSAWRKILFDFRENNKRAVIWGAGSKGVAFLTSLGIRDEILYAVDINPHKTGYFMPGTGQEIISLDLFKKYNPDVVIVMNPVYLYEIKQFLAQMGMDPEVISICDDIS